MKGVHAIANGDVLASLRDLPDNEFDGALFDPPYGLRFMGKRWDYDVPSVEVFRELLRVLKPGAPALFFGGTRTFHRMAVNAEDAGLELRDCLAWMYGSGFPKSLDVSKAIDNAAGAEREVIGMGAAQCEYIARGDKCPGHGDKNGRYGETVHAPATAPATPLATEWAGYGTALKPAWEPAVLARKPLDGTVAENVARWGCGALAIDDCRIETTETLGRTNNAKENYDPSSYCMATAERTTFDRSDTAGGRWPANVCLDEEAAGALDAQAGNRPSTPYRENVASGSVLPLTKRTAGGYSDDGGPSRFFYTAKVSKREREHGCAALPIRSAGECTDREDGSAALDCPRSGAGRSSGARNHHPTLKPIALTTWLARLILPPRPDATLLVPYSGAGSEIIGALRAGWGAVFGIEAEADYVAIAHARIEAWRKGEP